MKFFFSIFLSLVFLSSSGQDHSLLVGTYDSPKSEGIYVYKFNIRMVQPKRSVISKHPILSFLTVSPDQKYVYAVNETADSSGKGGGVTSFSFDRKKGTLTQLSRQSSEENHPCYISTDKTGKWVIAGNYSSGNFSILPAKNGMLGKAKKTVQHSGSGPDTARQKSPHVHGLLIQVKELLLVNLFVLNG